MRTLFKLALRNLLGAGVRTWLNVGVLSFAFVAIIWMQGYNLGIGEQAMRQQAAAEYAGGQYWQAAYDPYDPITLEDSHGVLPDPLQAMVAQQKATPILIVQATAYPNGRMMSAMLKGIDPGQEIISLPSRFLEQEGEELPVMIGSRMSASTGLKVGDVVTIRWRDADGVFDAQEFRIAQVFRIAVPSIDQGQFWIALDTLQVLTRMEGEATMVVVEKDGDTDLPGSVSGWVFRDLDFLMKDIMALVKQKTVGSSIFYFVLLFLAMLAIFDTQIFSIFKRKREIGTLMALGLTRSRVIAMFTLEGVMHSVLAAGVAAVYGIPLLMYSNKVGWAMPGAMDSYGFAIGDTLYPAITAGLIVGTVLLVLTVTTIVSYLPTRRIAKLEPTEALRGKMT
ncbi:MAG: FtsX-like permease family protein [Candidatus Aminicenantaceae bacterium]